MPNSKKISLKNDTLPIIVTVEGREMEPFEINNYLDNPNNKTIEVTAALANGSPLPKGLKCSDDGKITGKPLKGTAAEQPYNVNIIVRDKSGVGAIFPALLKIHTDESYQEDIKKRDDLANYWERLQQGLPLPNIEEILNRKISKSDIYWLLGRFATLTVWNGDDLSSPQDGKIIIIKGASDKFNVYEFYNDNRQAVAIVTSPKELFDHDRTMADAIQTAKAMAHNIKERGWNCEMAGFGIMTVALWMEVQHLNSIATEDQKKIDIYHYHPSDRAYYLYNYFYQLQKQELPPTKEIS